MATSTMTRGLSIPTFHPSLSADTTFPCSDNVQHDSIMTDAMCGQWWARACNLPPIADETCVRSTLLNIHKFNVMGFKNGQLGPVNGMRPDGRVDATCLQSVEVWTGTAYGAAATMLQEGLVEQVPCLFSGFFCSKCDG